MFVIVIVFVVTTVSRDVIDSFQNGDATTTLTEQLLQQMQFYCELNSQPLSHTIIVAFKTNLCMMIITI